MAHKSDNRKSWRYLLPALGLILAVVVTIGIAGASASKGSSPAAGNHGYVSPLVGNGKIAFVSNRTGSDQIFTMNANGSNQTDLSNNNSYHDSGPAWSPDGTWIAFLRSGPGSTHDIYIMDAYGGNLTPITHDGSADGAPRWSPDSLSIAFPRYANGNTDIYIANADGSNLLDLTNMPNSNEFDPTWQSSQGKIAFVSNRGGTNNIWSINLDGSQLLQLTTLASPQYATDPSYSPNGDSIVYTQGSSDSDVWKMNSDGSSSTDLTNLPTASDGTARWSPDGTKIVFASTRISSQLDIFTMDPNGSNVTNVSNAPGSRDLEPAWQPVGVPTVTPTPPCVSGGWGVVSSENTLSNTTSLYGVSALSPTEGWAVGYTTGNLGQNTLTEHWDGTSWQIIPSYGPQGGALAAVAEISPSDVWAVGYAQTASKEANPSKQDQPDGGSGFTLILHWNGTSWSRVPSPNPSMSLNNNLRSIAVVTSSDIWAVGYASSGSFTQQTLVEHWDGAHWTQVSSPTPGIGGSLSGVAVVSANSVWAVGYYSVANNTHARTLVEHWDGAHWTEISSPNIGSYDNFLIATMAIAANDVWAVGNYRDSSAYSHTLALHWNGASWMQVSTPDPGTSDNYLSGLAAFASNDIWAVGYKDEQVGTDRTLVEHWDGTAWTAVPSANSTESYNDLYSVSTAGSNELLAVGHALQSRTITLAEQYRYQCSAGSPTPTFTATAVPQSCQIAFEDVTAQSWFYQYVQYLYCHQVISGYSSSPPCSQPGHTCFEPNNTTTRGQVSKIVAKAFNLPINTMGGPHFSDVPVGSTFYQYIETLYNMGLVGGYPDGTFHPGSFVTRGQISKIVVSAAVATDPAHWLLLNPANNTFDDVLPGSTFYKYVETAATHNILSGYPCGVSPAGPCGALHKPYFITNNDTTRAQISKIVYLAVGP